jgi:hypothetical protein
MKRRTLLTTSLLWTLPAWLALLAASLAILGAIYPPDMPAGVVDASQRTLWAIFGAIGLAGVVLGVVVSLHWAMAALLVLVVLDIVHWLISDRLPAGNLFHAAVAGVAVVLLLLLERNTGER